MGKAIINIELDTADYKRAAQRMREYNYLFNTDLDLKAYLEVVIKSDLQSSKDVTTLD